MIAAQRFNARYDKSFPIYGVVTTGMIWKYLRLEEKTLWIDQEDYFIKEIGKLLSIWIPSLSSIDNATIIYQPQVPTSPLNSPTISAVIQPP